MPMLRFAWGAGTPFSLQASAGPVIVSSSAGVIGGTRVAATTTVEPGFGVLATYAGERFSLQGSAGEGSGVSAGFGGQTNNITAGALLQYKLTRRALLFANVGYLNFSGSSINGYSFSYAAGASYRLTRHISLTGEYYGYRTLGNGAGAVGLAGTPGQTAVTNVFMFGMVFQLAPWRVGTRLMDSKPFSISPYLDLALTWISSTAIDGFRRAFLPWDLRSLFASCCCCVTCTWRPQ